MTSQDTPELVERVALAITDCEAAGPLTLSAARVVARAAIEAMREPTPEMQRARFAAMRQNLDNLKAGKDDDPCCTYRATIDAALEPRR